MWSDNETNVDLLDFSHLVAAVLSVVHDRDLLPATIGISGDWGSGKSSLMQMVRGELEEESKKGGTLCISFNGWLFEGYEDAKTALMSTILKEISDNRTLGPKSKEALNKLLKRVNWMRLATIASKYATAYFVAGETGLGIVALADVPQLARKLADRFKGISEEEVREFLRDLPEGDEEPHLSIREFHRDFANLLAETNIETLVVFIDDLDRCTPDTIIGTLEAIKLFLFAPQTVFIIGADERLVRQAVRRRFPELQGDRAEVGRDYLEKIIQFPVRIPPLGHVELETYINLLFVERERLDDSQLEQLRKAAIHRSPDQLYDVTFGVEAVQEVLGEVSSELREGIALASYLAPVLTSGLSGNPRQTKRFLNTLMMRKVMADSRKVALELRVLAKLMLLEYFRPEAFQQLARFQIEQDGRPEELALMEQEMSPSTPDAGDGDVSSSQEKGSTNVSPAASKDGKRKTRPAENKSSSKESSDRKESKLLNELIDDSLMTWLSDPWIKNWLASEPALASYDLRPYFFFSRERLEAFAGRVLRLSPTAREVLASMTSKSDTLRRQAAQQASTISEAEAASVFNALAEQAKQQEDLSDDRSVLYSMFDLVEVRPELCGQLVAMLGQLAESAVTPAHVPRLVGATENSEARGAMTGLLERWSKSTINPPLAAAAKVNLKRLRKGTSQ